jgi:hypothetical protein
MGFEPVLSESGNVFYDPTLNVQDACLAEVPTCQIFVLVIGGRFGTRFKDTSKSITNYEYQEAAKHKIPIFALVERQVHTEYLVYQRNKGNPSVDATKINYPSVDSVNIFDFIEEVGSKAVNNALIPFSDYNELESYLRQQWAGMMFSFLAKQGETERVATMLETLTTMSNRIEFLSKQILSSVGTDVAKLTMTIYDTMLKYECIRDLAYAGFRPSPLDILQTKDYETLAKGRLTIDASEGFSISSTGGISKPSFEKNKEGYKELRKEVLKILADSGKRLEDLVYASRNEATNR